MASFTPFVFEPPLNPSIPIPDFVYNHPLFTHRRTLLGYHAFGLEWARKNGEPLYNMPAPVPGALPIPLPHNVENLVRSFDIDVWYDPNTPPEIKRQVSAWARRVYASHDGESLSNTLGRPS